MMFLDIIVFFNDHVGTYQKCLHIIVNVKIQASCTVIPSEKQGISSFSTHKSVKVYFSKNGFNHISSPMGSSKILPFLHQVVDSVSCPSFSVPIGQTPASTLSMLPRQFICDAQLDFAHTKVTLLDWMTYNQLYLFIDPILKLLAN